MSKNKPLSKYVFQIGTILSVLLLAASAMSSSFSAKVFAQEDGQDTSSLLEEANAETTSEGEDSSNQDLVDTEVQNDVQVEADVDVIFDEEDCAEASDNVDQQNTQSADQDAYVSTAVQTGVNVAVTPDFDFANCNPTDQISQGHSQSADQGDEGYQTSVQDARNYAYDYNFYANLPL
jgi:hypothetical protein